MTAEEHEGSESSQLAQKVGVKCVQEVHIPITCLTAFLLNSWLALNIILTLYNKWLFAEAGFPYPLLVTTSHSAVGIILGSVACFLKNVSFCCFCSFLCLQVGFWSLKLHTKPHSQQSRRHGYNS